VARSARALYAVADDVEDIRQAWELLDVVEARALWLTHG
jgi:hypothetical protein